MAASIASVSGRSVIVTPSTRAKSAGVEIGKSGLQTATKKRGAGWTVKLAAALGQLRAAADAEGNVAADTRTDLLEPLVRERGGDKIAQCAQHRRCVRAAAGHTGFGRDALDKRDVDAAAVVHRLAEDLCRLDGEVALIEQGSAAPSTRQAMPLPSV